MPIQLTHPPGHAFDLMVQFGVQKSLTQMAQECGVTAVRNASGSIIISLGDKVYGSVPVKNSTISLLKQHQLGPASIQAFTGQFEPLLKKAIADAQAATSPKATPTKSAWPGLDKVAVDPGHVDLSVVTQVTPAAPAAPVAPVVPAKPATTAPKVKLIKATQAYQPVEGTSSTADYRVFAVMKGLNLAVKVSGLQFAIRAEGSDLGSYKSKLDSFGIESKGGYASGHFSAGTKELIVKSLGAVVSLMGFNNLTQAADMSTLIKELS